MERSSHAERVTLTHSSFPQDFLLPPSDSQAQTEGGVKLCAKRPAEKACPTQRRPAEEASPPQKKTAKDSCLPHKIEKIGNYELPKHAKQKSEDGTGYAVRCVALLHGLLRAAEAYAAQERGWHWSMQ